MYALLAHFDFLIMTTRDSPIGGNIRINSLPCSTNAFVIRPYHTTKISLWKYNLKYQKLILIFSKLSLEKEEIKLIEIKIFN